MSDAGCSPIGITSFVAIPPTIYLGDPVTFIWTLSGVPISQSINQGIGPVAGTSYTTTPGVTGIITYTLTVTNGVGTPTANTVVTILPPLPRCGLGKICGTVVATEKPTIKLLKMAVALRDSTGHIIRDQFTDINGFYSFTGLAAGSYIARVEPDRTWNSSPNSITSVPNNVIGSVDFKMAGTPAIVTVTGVPGEFVAFTTTPILTPAPPDAMTCVSAVIDSDNKRKVNLRTGIYYMTCWKLNATHLPYTWDKGPSQLINGGATLWPQDQITEACL
jgi:hypothetical protein